MQQSTSSEPSLTSTVFDDVIININLTNQPPTYNQCVFPPQPPPLVPNPAPPPTFSSLFVKNWRHTNIPETQSACPERPPSQLSNITVDSIQRIEQASYRPNPRQENNGRRSDGSCGVCLYILCLLLSCISIAISIAAIVIGSRNIESCPSDPLVPVWLVAFGAGILLILLLTVFSLLRENDENSGRCCCLSSIISIFSISLVIMGSVIMYPSYSGGLFNLDCDKTLFKFAFWLVNGIYVILGALLIAGFIQCIRLELKRIFK